ncbi:MAG: hypothetical protein ABDH20_08005, partial [Thermus sp.]
EEPIEGEPLPPRGGYTARIRKWCPSCPEADRVARIAEEIRHSFVLMDNLLDLDPVRDGKQAYWTVHGPKKTVRQAAWHLRQAEALLKPGERDAFWRAIGEVVVGVEVELLLEDPSHPLWKSPPRAWKEVVRKEASFRELLFRLLGLPPRLGYLNGVAAQILDDALEAIEGKPGRERRSDEAMGRLTFMRAYGVSPEKALEMGRALKAGTEERLGRAYGTGSFGG